MTEEGNDFIKRFVDRQLKLLEMERQAEIAEVDGLLATHSAKELEGLGLCIRNLRVESVSTGMGGHRLVKLVRAEGGGVPLPPTRLGPGDIVSVRQPGGAPATTTTSGEGRQQQQMSGVVVKIREGSLTVAFDTDRDDGSDGLSQTASAGDTGLVVTQMGNDVTYKRMKEALGFISGNWKKLNAMQRAVLGMEPVRGTPATPPTKTSPERGPNNTGNYSSTLNAQQQEAVEFALRTEDVALIHGPPGTGKTTTVTELVRRLVVGLGQRVLVCAPSNIAVDNLGEKLAPIIVKIDIICTFNYR